MSKNFVGGIDYARLKRHYDCDDTPVVRDPTTGIALVNGIPFTSTPDYYISGLCAYLADPNVIDLERGWTTFAHGQTAAPAFLAAILAALGVAWPDEVPAFEAKRTTMLATQDCWVHFEGRTRVSQYIPAGALATGPYFTWNRRWLMMWVEQVTLPGVLYLWIEG
jgi:hypothetical protein